MMLKN